MTDLSRRRRRGWTSGHCLTGDNNGGHQRCRRFANVPGGQVECRCDCHKES